MPHAMRSLRSVPPRRFWLFVAVCALIEFGGLAVLVDTRNRSTLAPTSINTWKITGKGGPDRYVDPGRYRAGVGLVVGGIIGVMVLAAWMIRSDRPESGSPGQ